MKDISIRWLTPIATALLCIAACESDQPVVEVTEIGSGYWTASITLPGGQIDTGLEINRNKDGWQANLLNGQERVKIDSVEDFL